MNAAGGSLANRNILITGGSGFVGVHLAHELTAQRANVYLIDTHCKRQDLLAPLLKSERVVFVPCDVFLTHQLFSIRWLLQRADLIVHLGLKLPKSNRDNLDRLLETNLQPFEHLLSMISPGLQGVCLASSVSVYGSRPPVPVSEPHPAEPQSPYGHMKHTLEQALLKFGAQTGIPVSILRYSTIYGPGEINSPRAIPSFIGNLLAGRPPVIHGDGLDVNDYLFVQDATRGTRLALEELETSPGIYNLGSGRGHSTRAVADLVRRLTYVQLEPHFIPARQPRQHIVVDISRARSRLRFSPQTSLEEGMAREIDYHRSHDANRSTRPAAIGLDDAVPHRTAA